MSNSSVATCSLNNYHNNLVATACVVAGLEKEKLAGEKFTKQVDVKPFEGKVEGTPEREREREGGGGKDKNWMSKKHSNCYGTFPTNLWAGTFSPNCSKATGGKCWAYKGKPFVNDNSASLAFWLTILDQYLGTVNPDYFVGILFSYILYAAASVRK